MAQGPHDVETSVAQEPPQFEDLHNSGTFRAWEPPGFRILHNLGTSRAWGPLRLRELHDLGTSRAQGPPRLRDPHNLETSVAQEPPRSGDPHSSGTSVAQRPLQFGDPLALGSPHSAAANSPGRAARARPQPPSPPAASPRPRGRAMGSVAELTPGSPSPQPLLLISGEESNSCLPRSRGCRSWRQRAGTDCNEPELLPARRGKARGLGALPRSYWDQFAPCPGDKPELGRASCPAPVCSDPGELRKGGRIVPGPTAPCWHGSSRPAGRTGGSGTGPKEGVPRGKRPQIGLGDAPHGLGPALPPAALAPCPRLGGDPQLLFLVLSMGGAPQAPALGRTGTP